MCPGYPPETNDRFLDQTGEVLAKARLAESARIEQRHLNRAGNNREVPSSLTEQIEARASNFFLSKYILGSNFEYLAGIFKPNSEKDELLSASIEAVGLASLANELDSWEISEKARKSYVHAIQATNTALRCPTRAAQDSTLLAVLLLSLYEVITCTSQPTSCLWERHIKGAIALTRFRGRQQMQSQFGLKLLNQTTASVAISAHRNKEEVPPEVVDLVACGLQYASKNEPAWSFRLISFRSANLRAAVHAGSISDPDEIIAAAMEIDRAFVAWMRALPSSWQFQIHYVEQANPTLVYEGYYHLYPFHGMAQGMNAWRMSRLQINETIWEQLLLLQTSPLRSHNYSPLLIHQVESTITRLCSDICAAVPQYVELPAEVPVSACRVQTPSSITCDAPLPVVAKTLGSGFTHSARSYGIVWPLMMVANCVIPESRRRAWTVNRLRYISTQMKNPQAKLALEVLEGKQDAGKR